MKTRHSLRSARVTEIPTDERAVFTDLTLLLGQLEVQPKRVWKCVFNKIQFAIL